MSIGSFLNEGLENGIKAGTTILESNKAINPIKKTAEFMLGEYDTGIRGTLRALGHGANFDKALKSAYTHRVMDDAGKLGERTLNWKAVAGTYVGAAAAGRVLSGGGIYRDAQGNPNLPVVPFI